MSKILLIAAPRPDSNETAMHMGDGRPPMGLAYISAYVENLGHETKIIDLYHFGGGHKDEQAGAELYIPFEFGTEKIEIAGSYILP